jgi:hypothetical protein
MRQVIVIKVIGQRLFNKNFSRYQNIHDEVQLDAIPMIVRLSMQNLVYNILVYAVER